MDKEEYLMIFVIAFLAVTTILVLFRLANDEHQSEFGKVDAIIQECIASGHYTREECIFIGSDFDD